MPRWCPLPLHSLLPHAVVYWYVSGSRAFTFEQGGRGGFYDAAVVPTPFSLSACTRCCVLVRFRPSCVYV